MFGNLFCMYFVNDVSVQPQYIHVHTFVCVCMLNKFVFPWRLLQVVVGGSPERPEQTDRRDQMWLRLLLRMVLGIQQPEIVLGYSTQQLVLDPRDTDGDLKASRNWTLSGGSICAWTLHKISGWTFTIVIQNIVYNVSILTLVVVFRWQKLTYRVLKTIEHYNHLS